MSKKVSRSAQVAVTGSYFYLKHNDVKGLAVDVAIWTGTIMTILIVSLASRYLIIETDV